MEKENVALKRTITELKELLKQTEAGRQQLQASYDEALQALADSEAKREIAEKELKIAQDQMATMWKELDSLHKRLDGLPSNSKHIKNPIESSSHVAAGVNEESLELNCTLCHEKFK
jgi:chromosome segregation ATPase